MNRCLRSRLKKRLNFNYKRFSEARREITAKYGNSFPAAVNFARKLDNAPNVFGIYTSWERGLKEMDDAVALAPDRIDVIIGRSATIIGLARSGWDAGDTKGRELLKSALLGYEEVYIGSSGFAVGKTRQSRVT